MSRHKGRTKSKLVERDFPHHVDMMVPEFGFGARRTCGSIFGFVFAVGLRRFRLRRDITAALTASRTAVASSSISSDTFAYSLYFCLIFSNSA